MLVGPPRWSVAAWNDDARASGAAPPRPFHAFRAGLLATLLPILVVLVAPQIDGQATDRSLAFVVAAAAIALCTALCVATAAALARPQGFKAGLQTFANGPIWNHKGAR